MARGGRGGVRRVIFRALKGPATEELQGDNSSTTDRVCKLMVSQQQGLGRKSVEEKGKETPLRESQARWLVPTIQSGRLVPRVRQRGDVGTPADAVADAPMPW